MRLSLFVSVTNEDQEEEEAYFILDSITNKDPPNAHQAQHRPVQATQVQ